MADVPRRRPAHGGPVHGQVHEVRRVMRHWIRCLPCIVCGGLGQCCKYCRKDDDE